MAVKKVSYNGNTLIDLSTDTVSSAADIADGKTGHLNDGTVVTGTLKNVAVSALHEGGGPGYVSQYGNQALFTLGTSAYCNDVYEVEANKTYLCVCGLPLPPTFRCMFSTFDPYTVTETSYGLWAGGTNAPDEAEGIAYTAPEDGYITIYRGISVPSSKSYLLEL